MRKRFLLDLDRRKFALQCGMWAFLRTIQVQYWVVKPASNLSKLSMSQNMIHLY